VPMRTTLFSACLMLAGLAQASAHVTTVRIDRVEPFAGGATFGDTGAYERVIGVARGELDPTDPRNAVIVGLDRAPRNAAGMVEYETDLFLLRPVDQAKGNHQLLFDVLNRGNKMVTNALDRTMPADSSNDPTTLAHAGDGFLFRRGYTIAWAGWDPDSPKTNAGMTIRIPALADVEQEIRDEFVSATRGPPLTSFRLSYTAASLDTTVAHLTMRARADDTPTEVPADRWRFTDARTVVLLPEGTTPSPGVIYELNYRARSPWVSGIGFAAQRDVVAFLKSDSGDANPAGEQIETAIGFGISQSGRFLRDFIKFGFNQDEDGHKVFDGVLSHIAGIGGVFLNELFAQPFRTRTQHQDSTMPENSFPFSSATTHDPVSNQDGSLLRNDGFDPLLIETNTDAEYWQKGASLLGTDPLGKADLSPPTRLFLIAGSQHTGRFGASDAAGPCANLRNPHDPYPALRALLVALSEWITTGEPAPASRIPLLADGTLVPAEQLHFPKLPGFALARAPNAINPTGDWVHPTPVESPYHALVPAVDADGNDRAGLRLPDVAVPLGTGTGFNLYKPPFPAGEMCDRDGSSLPFAHSKADKAAGDPRPSVVERYGTKEVYIALVTAAASQLVGERLLLPEDADHYVIEARSAADRAFPQ
ncbi:MAG TPA: alpha/beta hydrolase domain-containing protein, partial [Acetobacteraceae bacterium]|nr:alpha/beta hydrolase domain-containing protein [Acetobacteraceae bacterium]